MATNRPFARNLATDPLILGTEQIGNLAIGIPTIGFTATGLDWYGGPDEELGYVIGKDNPDGQQAAVAPGDPPITAYLGFWRSDALTDESFISFGNDLLGANHATAAEVKTALNTAGYWTSYESATPPPPTGLPYTLDVVSFGYGTPAAGKIIMADTSSNNTTNPDGIGTINISLTDGDSIDQTTLYQAWVDSMPAYSPGGTPPSNAAITLTQGALTATYSIGNVYIPYVDSGNNNINISGGPGFALTQTVLAGSSFNSTDPIIVTLVPNTLEPPPPTGLPYTLDVINSDIFSAPATGKIAMADSSFNNTTNPDGLRNINISLTDGDGIDQTAIYQAWFNSIPAYGSGITNNATVTLTQGALTATYNMPDQMYSQNSYVFIISTSYISIYGGSEFDLAQTVLAGASFNSTDPITVTLVPNTL